MDMKAVRPELRGLVPGRTAVRAPGTPVQMLQGLCDGLAASSWLHPSPRVYSHPSPHLQVVFFYMEKTKMLYASSVETNSASLNYRVKLARPASRSCFIPSPHKENENKIKYTA